MATKKNSQVELIAEKEKRYARFVEETKIRSDYLKHVATLDTGSILIIITFLQKPITPGTNTLITISIISFLLSLLIVNITQYILTNFLSDSVDNIESVASTEQKRIARTLTFLSYAGLGIGLSFLTGFATVNF